MPVAVMLLNVEGREINQIAEQLSELPGVTEVYSVAGIYDLVAVLRLPTNESLADLVAESIRSMNGIKSSQTLIAFRTYAPSDVNSLFDMK